MIPFRDNIPSRSFPAITVSIIIANVCLFFYELSLGSRSFERFIMHYGVVPTTALAWPHSHVPFTVVALPFFTSLFLHGGWLHLIGNMWFLWIFGDNVEDLMGHGGHLSFYLAVGVIASATHVVMNKLSTNPLIGASGAIAGVLGAYTVLFPRARILSLIPLGLFTRFIAIPAFLFLPLWFVMQFVYGLASLAGGGGGVAWWAHVGGFI